LKLLYYLLKASKKNFFIAAITGVMTGLCSTFLIKTIHETLNEGIPDLGIFLIKIGLLLIGYPLFAVLSSYKLARLTQSIVHNLRTQLSNEILNARYVDVERNRERLLPILTYDINVISKNIERLPSVVTGLTTVVGLFSYMIWLSPMLFAFTTGIFIIAFMLIKLALPALKKYSLKARDKWDEVFKALESLVIGLKELSLNSKLRNVFVNDLLLVTSAEERELRVREGAINAVISKITDIVLLAGILALIILVYSTSFVDFNLLGDFLLIALFTVSPLASATGFMANMKVIEVSLEKFEKVGLDISRPAVKQRELSSTKLSEPLIQLKAATYNYYNEDEDDHFLLGPINLTIQSNEIIYIVGGNGSGKTTLAKLIIGLYEPIDGKLSYLGEDITQNNLPNYRDNFKAIFDDSYLFDRILAPSEDLPENYAQHLIDVFRLDKKVKLQGNKFSTTKLSQGQKHRLKLIAAIMENANVYLFDEWAANQDPVFKKVFYTDVLPMLKKSGKTILVITHDDHYFNYADRVIKLRNGNITENGNSPLVNFA
jgi:putative ATP-binding cassette transporter